MWSLLATALLLGSVSSVHCVGMCGPLALSLPLSSLSAWERQRAMLIYHAGRLSVYGALGAIFGVLGRHIYLAGFQQVFSIVLGAAILVIAVVTGVFPHSQRLGRLSRPLNKLIFRLWQSKGRYRYFVLGMANGLLPCGMVYLAVAGALSFAHVWESSLFMILFGTGTLPALVLISSSRRLMGGRTRNFIRRAMPGLAVLMGVLLIIRGLDLGIPFLSPILGQQPAHPISCH